MVFVKTQRRKKNAICQHAISVIQKKILLVSHLINLYGNVQLCPFSQNEHVKLFILTFLL